jgi:son of sevenless-like protein
LEKEQQAQHIQQNTITKSRTSTVFEKWPPKKDSGESPLRSARTNSTESSNPPQIPKHSLQISPPTPPNQSHLTLDSSSSKYSPRPEDVTTDGTEITEVDDPSDDSYDSDNPPPAPTTPHPGDEGPQKIEFDEHVISTRERRGRLQSLRSTQRPPELEKLVNDIKIQIDTKEKTPSTPSSASTSGTFSSWFGKKNQPTSNSGSFRNVSIRHAPHIQSNSPSPRKESPRAENVSPRKDNASSPVPETPTGDIPVGQRFFVDKKGVTLVVRYPVNLFGDSDSRGARPRSIRSAQSEKSVGGVKISLFTTNEFYQSPVECLVVSNTSDLSCSGNENAYFAQELAKISPDVVNQCSQYLTLENTRHLKPGASFCGTTGKLQNQEQSHVIHLFVDHHVLDDKLSIVSNESEVDVVPLDKLIESTIYKAIQAGVRSVLESADVLNCASIAFCPTQAPVSLAGGQYGVDQKYWIHVQRSLFHAIFEYQAENKLSCSVLDFRLTTCTTEEAQLLKKFLDVDYKNIFLRHHKSVLNRPISATISSPTEETKPVVVKVPEPKDPSLYYDIDFRTINYTYEEDSPDNIEWMTESTFEDEGVEIKCATLEKLIERVTYHRNFDNAYLYAFLLTYRSFTTPHGLMDKLITRYNIPPPKNILDLEETNKQAMQQEFGKWQQEFLNQVRLRVTQVIKYWIEKHFYDFEGDERLIQKVQNLCNTMEKTQGSAYAQQIQRMLKKTNEFIEKRKMVVMNGHFAKALSYSEEEIDENVNLPKTLYPRRGRDNLGAVPLLDWPAEELARQITFAEYVMFKSIYPKECLNQSWNKDQREERAPHIFQMINWFNMLSKWVAMCVIEQSVLKERKAVLKKMIEIAHECRLLNNFNAVFEIVSGLQNAAVYRLSKTWEALSVSTKRIYDEMVALISRDGNYRMIRQAILYVKPPCIPYIGVFLTDLTFIEDGNPDVLKGKLNFIKRRKLAMLIRDLQTYQQTPYAIAPVSEVQVKLKNSTTDTTEEELYKQSLILEPRRK